MSVRAVVFDVGGVLEVNPSTGWMDRWALRLGLSTDELGRRIGRLWRGGDVGAVTLAEITIDSPDFGHLEPMVDATETELERANVSDTPEVVLADAGYWHQKQMESVVSRGIQVLIPPDSKKREDARPGWDGGYYAFMRRVLATEHAGGLYRRRQFMIEPVFGHTKFNRRFDRFRRRGRAAVRSEWRLIAATHNLVKLHRHRTASATA